jgi:hypothetical protein
MTDKPNPFSKLSNLERETIEEAYSAGLTPEQIGVKLGLDFDDVTYYCEHHIVPPRSRFERLEGIVDDLEDTCINTKHQIDTGRADSAMMLQSYQRLISEYRLAVAELDGLKQPQDVVGEIVEKVLNPFLIDLTRVCTEETSKLREEMLKLDVPQRDANGVATDIFRRLTNSIKHTLDAAINNLNSYHGVSDKTKKDDKFFRDNMLQ